MRNLFFSLFVLLQSSMLLAEEQPLPPPDPAFEGVHGIVLMNKNASIFASHMPTYEKPGNYQILYRLQVKDINLVQVVKHNQLVTVKPESFNLQRLIRGEKISIKGDVYIGHYEREGMLVYEGITLNFDQHLFVRELTDLKPPSNIQEYSAVEYRSKTGRLYVHHIQQAPSYDHIIYVDLEASCPIRFATSGAVARENEVLFQLLNCGTMKPLYYETQDFAGQ